MCGRGARSLSWLGEFTLCGWRVIFLVFGGACLAWLCGLFDDVLHGGLDLD